MNAMDLDPEPDILTHWCTDLYNLPMPSISPFLYTIPTATSLSSSSSSSSSSSPPSTSGGAADDMASSIRSVEEILSYRFKDKSLLKEALTHSSYNNGESFKSYQRLEFVGDAVLGLALSNYVFLAYPNLEPGQLSSLRAANISTEKLARVAVRHGLHRFIRHHAAPLHDKIKEFADAVSLEDDTVVYGGLVKAPKILADIVESVAAAIYVDLNLDLQQLWVIFRALLEPIVTLEDLQKQPQPVTMLFELCQKQGKQVDIKYWKNGEKNIATVYVDGKFIASGSSEKKETAKLNAAKQALLKLSKSMPTNFGRLDFSFGLNKSFEIDGAKQKLHELCGKKKWPKPIYSLEKDEGPPHDKKYVSSVQIPTIDGVLYMEGDEKFRVKEAQNSAASLIIRALQESNYL
ncbi:ribonuclease 3-like protein 2 isoform X1 [Quercus robur]|uniref:ribonuclease 3-like protein 2 isoform X1 n=1 Tax=Quercus robur TaxID=38942 RepID=UPI002162A61E|nr:ribonuclease 3-like protein 2 isoform X1 [Quercus robur]